MPKSEPSHEIVDISPKLAGEYLEKNNRNRSTKPQRIRLYAEAMTNGEWRFTHEGIMFCDHWADPDTKEEFGETLMEGQNRLHAIILSGKTVPMTVWRHCDPREMEVIGRAAPRNHGDILGISRPSLKNPALLANIIGSFIRNGLSYNATIDDWMIRRVLEKIEPEIKAVAEQKQMLKSLVRREFTAALVLATLIDAQATSGLVNNLRGGLGYTRKDPAKALRAYLYEYVMAMPKDRDTVDMYFYMVCNGIAAKLEGAEMTTLKLSPDGLAWLRNQARAKLGPIMDDLFGGTPRGFYTPTMRSKLAEAAQKE